MKAPAAAIFNSIKRVLSEPLLISIGSSMTHRPVSCTSSLAESRPRCVWHSWLPVGRIIAEKLNTLESPLCSTHACTYDTPYMCIASIVWRGTVTIVRANEFRNFTEADVIWDNAHIACTPGTDSARLAPQLVSRQWRTSTSVNAIVASRAAIGDTKTLRNCNGTRINVSARQ